MRPEYQGKAEIKTQNSAQKVERELLDEERAKSKIGKKFPGTAAAAGGGPFERAVHAISSERLLAWIELKPVSKGTNIGIKFIPMIRPSRPRPHCLRLLCYALVWGWYKSPVVQSQSRLDTASLYEDLYSNHGYHEDLSISHAHELVDMISSPDYRKSVSHNGVLDIGCSHGRGVQMLWEKNISASGMDISKTAVSMAKISRPSTMWCGEGQQAHNNKYNMKTEPEVRHCCRGACFRVGSATAIPFAKYEFDAIMTTDVLEHLLPEDVPVMVEEFKRVARYFVFVSVATQPEKEKKFVEDLRHMDNKGVYKKVKSLHTTILHRDQWIQAFEQGGMELLWSQKCKHCSPQVLVFKTNNIDTDH